MYSIISQDWKHSAKMFLNDLLQQFGVAKTEKIMAAMLGFITLTQVHAIVGILILAGGGIVSILFAVRKHLKKERAEHETHVIKIIKEMNEADAFEEGTTFEQKREMAIEHIKLIK